MRTDLNKQRAQMTKYPTVILLNMI